MKAKSQPALLRRKLWLKGTHMVAVHRFAVLTSEINNFRLQIGTVWPVLLQNKTRPSRYLELLLCVPSSVTFPIYSCFVELNGFIFCVSDLPV